MRPFLTLILLLLLAFQANASQAEQDSTLRQGPVEKLFDFGDRVIDAISGEKWAFIPAIVYSPETSLGIGARAIRVFRHKDTEDPTLRPSTLPITFLYTLRHQTIFTSELDLWANGNREYFNARIELSNFPFQYFGVGNTQQQESGEFYTTRYGLVQLHYERLLLKGLYLGPKYEFRVDDIYKRVPGGILETSQVPGFDGQRISGFGLMLNHDTRDNIFQPKKGWYNRVSWMSYPRFLGSNFVFDQTVFDLRKYIHTGANRVLAIQSWWSFTSGTVPFQDLSLIGGSDRMRGYFEGRYRDLHAMVQQVEYRTPIYRNLGMVFYAHMGQVAPKVSDFSFSRLHRGIGLGFRYRLNKEGLNIRLDIAYGDQRAFYFGLNEVI